MKQKATRCNEPPSCLFDFEFFLHVDFLSVRVIEHILQECEFLTWNDLDTESVLHLPLSFQGDESLIDVSGHVRMDV